jgi:hypothetical protein
MPIQLRSLPILRRKSVPAKSPKRTFAFGIDKGMWTSGDPMKTPDGYFRLGRNLFLRAGRLELRPQFTYDNLASVRGLGIWYDDDNLVSRLVAQTSTTVDVKATSGETWGGDISSNNNGFDRFIDTATYRGRFYAITPSADSGSIPLRVQYYDGTLYERDHAIPIIPYSLTPYKERMFYGGARLRGRCKSGSGGAPDGAYDPAEWTLTNISTSTISPGTPTLYRITPTSTTAARLRDQIYTSFGGFFGSTGDDYVSFRSQLRGVSPTYAMPISVQILYASEWATGTAYAVGQVVVPTTANNYRYRCTVAGTSHATTEPTWPTTVGSEVTDNGTLKWICDGSDIAAKTDSTIPSASTTTEWTTTSVSALIPEGSNTDLDLRITLYNDANPTITLASLDFGYMDGLAVTDPQKQNHGQQVEAGTYGGRFFYPFFSNENTTTFEIYHRDYLYWSDPLEPRSVVSSNYFRVTETPGPITAVRAVAGKLCVFKRQSVVTFGATEDPDNPVLPEGEAKTGFGCLNPKALDVLDDFAYFIGEDEFYRWRPGMDQPEPLCGDAMRETIMAKGSGWVESQSAPANRALLAIDQRNREVWVYTQKGLLYVYSIDRRGWSGPFEAGMGTGTEGYQVCDMIYNPNTREMYFAFSTAAAGTAGLARLDPTQAVAEDSISSSGTLPVRADLQLRPLELATPFYELLAEKIRMKLKVTATQTDQTLTGYVSKDQGVTWPKSNQVVVDPVSTGEYRRGHITVWQQGESLMLRLLKIGKGGPSQFAISHVEVDVQLRGGEYPNDNFTAGSASL